MQTKRCTCGKMMEGTDHLSKDGREIITLWMCTGCLRRHQTTQFNPRWIDMTKVPVITGRHGKKWTPPEPIPFEEQP